VISIIKIGGNVINNDAALHEFLTAFAQVEGKKILVHGGGKLATTLAEQMGIEQQMVNGRRVTDSETLKIVTMVYAGFINKNIVAQLHARGCKAIGVTGADGNLILAHKRVNADVDYGFVGDVDAVDAGQLKNLLAANDAVVVAPITHDGKGQLLNTNADTIAQELAQALGKQHTVQLIYCFEKAGVLMDANDDNSCIERIDKIKFEELVRDGVVYEGMLPKLQNAFSALDKGVNKVVIGKASELAGLIANTAGTTIEQ
jgi:acetylglutamate kinase